ncbi:phosphate ABC transporter substrate-binding protein [Alkalicaulis satelles]|uniref:Phosphate ABC transporter substrate-binding protein n=1 Tax=Alkalicaulis satelles TaxID=2609175 RepID=A0A5M6ZKU8_9PROT|nr:substrate-binding domain-containing protein [Alkalicaulis satelles]KAA5805443.1 phosphate ABC transporter substrate-binding protein [Alkalicaulis satelles]
MTGFVHLTAGVAALALLAACGEPREAISLSDEPDETTQDADTAQAGAPAPTRRGSGRQGLRIVGSSTVFPFTTSVAENFGAKTEFPTPVVESVGTGGGMNLFCAGVGLDFPDMTGASRRMLASEYQLCRDNGVTSITEIRIGYDGIVFANSIEAEPVEFRLRDLYLALAAEIPAPLNTDGEPLLTAAGGLREGFSFSDAADYDCATFIANPFRRWSEVNSDLPAERIEVFGPPPTSGTRDALVELGIQGGARAISCMAELRASDRVRFNALASRLREDGPWIDGGEDDNVIVRTVHNTPGMFGVFGYSYLEQNADRVQGASIDGVEPTYETISEGDYPVSRSMFVYVKNQHDGVAPGLRDFIIELTDDEAWGPFGYLADRGLIALPEARRIQQARDARALTPMSAPE